MNRALIALTLALVAAGCSDGTSPTAIQPPLAQAASESSWSTELHILQQAPTSTDSAVVVKYKTYLGSLWVGGLLPHFSNYAVAW